MSDMDYELVEQRSRELRFAVDEVTPFCESWAADLRAQGGAQLKDMRELSSVAGAKAAQFAKTGAAFADWQPGNGTSYKTFLYDFRRPQVEALDPGRDPADALRMGPEAQWGGRLLVAFPELSVGRSRAVALIDCYHPTFVAEQFGFQGIGDSIPVAILLTFFGAQASVWLRESVSS